MEDDSFSVGVSAHFQNPKHVTCRKCGKPHTDRQGWNLPTKNLPHLPNVHVAVSGSVSTWRILQNLQVFSEEGERICRGGSRVMICWVLFSVETNRISICICGARMIYAYYGFIDLCDCVKNVSHVLLLMSFHDVINSGFVSRLSKAWNGFFWIMKPYSCEPPQQWGDFFAIPNNIYTETLL